MSVAQTIDRRFLILLTVVVLAIIVLSFLSFEIVSHFTVIWQAVNGVASNPDIPSYHP